MYEHIIKVDNLPEDKKNYWFLIPRLILDKTKYRGKGRPRKSDYRVYPSKDDLVEIDWRNIPIEKTKNWIMSKGDGI